jgi:hypothetical protein
MKEQTQSRLELVTEMDVRVQPHVLAALPQDKSRHFISS